MNLRAQQQLLWDVVRGTRAIDGDVEVAFAPTRRGPLRDRLQLYADMYRWRHLDAIRAIFPVLSGVLGESLSSLVREYVDAHPSNDPSIDHVGRALPGWLHARGLPGAADLAAFELARADVFDAADVTPLPFAAFVARASEAPSLRFRFVPALRLVDVIHAVAPANEGVPAIGPHLVWRRDLRVVDAAVTRAEASALVSMLGGGRLGEACEAFASDQVPAAAAARAIGSWFAEALVAAIE